MTNVIPFPQHGPAEGGPDWHLDQWPFLEVKKAADPEALPVCGHACKDGPVVEYRPRYVRREMLKNPTVIVLWLPQCIKEIGEVLLAECLESSDGIGRFTSLRWQWFRREACRQTVMEWSEILDTASREGIEWMAGHLAACLLMESGLLDEWATA